MVLFCKEKCAVQMNGGSVWGLAGKGLGVFQKESWLRDCRALFPGLPRSPPSSPSLPVLLCLPLSPALHPFNIPPDSCLGKEGSGGEMHQPLNRRWGQLQPTGHRIPAQRNKTLPETGSFSGYRQAGPGLVTSTPVVPKYHRVGLLHSVL